MANVHKHRQRVVRGIPDDLIDDFDKAARELGSDRSAEVRRFMEWFVGRAGAEDLRRPDRSAE